MPDYPRNHVHIDTVTSGTPEFAPVSTYGVIARKPIHEAHVKVVSTANGRTRVFQLNKSAVAAPILRTHEELIIKLYGDEVYSGWERYQALTNWLGQLVYYVPLHHPADGSSHAAYVQTMLFEEAEVLEFLDPLENNLHVRIVLKDVSRDGQGKTTSASPITTIP